MNSTGCGYETRFIPSAKWVVADIDVSDIEGSSKIAFWKLFRYFDGENSNSTKMNMTAPVVFKWYMDASQNYTLTAGQMHFYIPSAFQSETPLPADDGVDVVQFTDSIMYNRAFGGNDVNRYEHEFERLGEAIQRDELSIHTDFSVTAEFTNPMHGPQRHEVAFVAA